MSVLIEDKTVSGTRTFVASYFTFCYYISRLGFVSILCFIFLPDTQRIFGAWQLLLLLLFISFVYIYYRKKICP